MTRVRAFAERDYAAFTRMWRICEREAIEPEELRARDARWDSSRYDKLRVVAVDEEDVPLAYGEIYHEPTRFEPLRYFVRMGTEPRLRRKGMGAAVWDRLAAELAERRARVACLWADDHTACVEFMAARGFREVVRSYAMVRATSTAPVLTGATAVALERSGIRITSLAELMRSDPRAVEKAHRAYFATRLDQPSLGPVTESPAAAWRAEHVDAPDALLDAYFVALDGADVVGQCCVHHGGADDVLVITVTGVLPSHRRRGIGRALKLRLHSWARANGYREVHTSVARENTAMARLNESLGYVIVASWGGYELVLATT